ncbi:MAG: 23S rRNA (adenine(2503)-C(2))-methyltransferase RlmN [Pseudobutyrivibrio sp.]|nr:23S rRNA (adenine(2503)-C(2))-methyltransferase RlmN [Pseudobutyrivibrio sp.]
MCNEKELTDIRSLNLTELTDFVTGELGEPKFRAKQLYEWMHQHLAQNYDEMKNIPKALKEKLETSCNYHPLKQIDMQVSKIDGTRKYLFELFDGQMVESVWMSYKHGNSVCISSQVGCKMGCRFCASTLDGWVRNLTPSEMLGQIYAIQRDTGERVSNLVVMGTGEPMDNYDNIVKFVRLLSDENGLNISQRNITVSTCGIVPRIKQLAEEDLTITLAISLHAPNQQKRAELMPIANKYEIHELIDACEYYFNKTGRRITFEYSLVGGVNDRDEDAAELGQLIGHLNCHVNLIPVNPIKERDFVSPSMDRAYAFQKKIEKYVNNATIRREMGRDIDGACGQLRKRKMDASKGTI